VPANNMHCVVCTVQLLTLLNDVLMQCISFFCSWLWETVTNQPILSLWLTIYMYGRSSSTYYWLCTWCFIFTYTLSYRSLAFTEDFFCVEQCCGW